MFISNRRNVLRDLILSMVFVVGFVFLSALLLSVYRDYRGKKAITSAKTDVELFMACQKYQGIKPQRCFEGVK